MRWSVLISDTGTTLRNRGRCCTPCFDYRGQGRSWRTSIWKSLVLTYSLSSVFVGAAATWVLAFRNSWTSNTQVTTLACILLQPPLILIDHGHFQYNSISLGLSMAALVCIFQKHQVLGSILFCCAINHKHMALYFAPAIFGHLLGRAVEQRSFKQVQMISHIASMLV